MTLPNWFRIVWWFLLLGLLSVFLLHRYPALQKGEAVPADIFVFAVCMALPLAPLFKEMSFLGIRLKQDIGALRGQVEALRAEIQNSVSVNTQFNPQINVLPLPPPDTRLHELAPVIRSQIDAALQRYGLAPKAPGPDLLAIPDDSLFLFRVRHNLEHPSDPRRFPRPRESHCLFAIIGLIVMLVLPGIR